MDQRITSALPESTLGSADLGSNSQPVLKKTYTVQDLWHRAHSISPFGTNIALTVGVNSVIAVFGLITGPLCARLLGPDGRGQLAAIQNLYWFVGILAMLGMPEATLYFTAQKKDPGGRILASSILLVVVISPLFLLVAYLVAPVLLAAQSANLVKVARWFLLGIPLYALCTIPVFTLRGRNDIPRWNLLRLVPTVGWLVLLLGLWKFSAATPATVAVGYLAMLAVTLVPTFFLSRRTANGSFRPDMRRWPKMLKYGVPLAAAAIPFTLNVRLDQMIMAALLPASSLGIYVVAVSWSGAVPPMLLSIGTVLFPRVAGADAADRGKLVAQGTRISAFMAVALVLGVSALTPFAIPLLFGKAFTGSVAVGVVLVFAAGILGMNIVLEESLRGLGEPSIVFWGEAVGLVVTAGMLVALLRPMGIMGAGIASVLGYASSGLVLLSGVRRRTHHSLAEVLVLNSFDLKRILEKFAALRTSPQSEI